MTQRMMPGLERRLVRDVPGDVHFDPFTRGRYATDASHYQIMPVGVVAPRTMEAATRAIALAREESVSVLPRGGGTSQCGQTVNHSLVVDCSKYLNRVLEVDVEGRRCVVQPGIVLDELNRAAQAARAVVPGRHLHRLARHHRRHGRQQFLRRALAALRQHARQRDLDRCACWPTARTAHFGAVSADLSGDSRGLAAARHRAGPAWRSARARPTRSMRTFPKVQRRVGGYNLDAFLPGNNDLNLAHILVGSEGTLGFSTQVELKLSPLLGRRAVGVCHFGSFYEAMDAAQHLVKLEPIAVELVDRTMIELAREIAMFRPTLEQFVRGEPDAILLVEFGEDDQDENMRRLKQLARD